MRFLLKISLALKLTTFQVHGQLPNEPITEVRCNNVDYWCHLHLCKQRGYKKNVLMTSTLKANIIVSDGSMNTTNTQLKKIDDRQMMLTFSPKLAIGWEDSRVISIDPIIRQVIKRDQLLQNDIFQHHNFTWGTMKWLKR